MKILYVSAALIPSRIANSINIVKSCAAMARLGHEVVLLHPAIGAPEIEKGVEDPHAFYGVDPNFRLKRIPCPDLPGGRGLYCLLSVMFALRFRPDLVFGRYIRATYHLCRCGFPTAYEFHSAIRFKGQKSRFFEKLSASPNLVAFLTVSAAMGEHLRKNEEIRKSGKPVLVFGCGGDPPVAVPRPAAVARNTNGYNIGYGGRLDESKGVGLICELAKLTDRHDFHLFGGSLADIAMWRERIPFPHVHFHGFIPPSDLPRFLAAMDLCLLPCQKNPKNPDQQIFGSPLKMFDYMGQKKAILASDFAEIREVLDETCAVLLDPEDPAAWADAIESLSPGDIRRLGEAAHERFVTTFTREARYRRLLAELSDMMASHGTGR